MPVIFYYAIIHPDIRIHTIKPQLTMLDREIFEKSIFNISCCNNICCLPQMTLPVWIVEIIDLSISIYDCILSVSTDYSQVAFQHDGKILTIAYIV